MCFNPTADTSTLNGSSLKQLGKFTYLGSSVLSIETDINTWLAKAWIALDRLSVIWKSVLTDKIKRCFFKAAIVSILLYGCTTWTLTKRTEKKLPTKQQIYDHLPPIMKAIQIRRTRHAGYFWRSMEELISDELLWTPSHRRAKTGRSARTNIRQLCADTACSPEDLPEAMDDREGWRERVRDIRTDGVTWWWWWRIRGQVKWKIGSLLQRIASMVDLTCVSMKKLV